MKKYLILILVLTSVNIFAQPLIWKPIIGVNTTIYPRYYYEKPILGFDVGVLLDKEIQKQVYIEGGVLFSKKNEIMSRFLYYQNNYGGNLSSVTDKLNYSTVKLPVVILYKQNKKNPMVFSFGPFIKYISKAFRISKRNQSIFSYSDYFYIKTNSGNRIGTGLQSSIRKEFNIAKHKFSTGLYYDFETSMWMYPTNPNYEMNTSFWYRRTNTTLLISMNF